MSATENQVNTLTQLGTIFKALASEQAWPGFEIGLSESEYLNAQEAITLCRTPQRLVHS